MTKSSRAPRGHTRNHRKRYGRHHKRDRDYVKTYLPYLPLFISILASIFLSFWQPKGNTLAYSTSMSVSGLLSATNQHRANNGRASLKLNSKLNSSAQAKANDMVARNYWSHNTPTGQEPWVFFDNAGYAYLKAGENLVYGFATSADAVVGWMNSPSHKANMLDSAFSEVGFGFANSPNFNSDGQQTVVVAHYAKPQVAAATSPATAAPTPTTQKAPVTSSPAPKAAPKKALVPVAAKPEEEKPINPAPITTEQPLAASTAVPQTITRGQALTNGKAPWIMGAMTALLGVLLLFKVLHLSFRFKDFLRHHRQLQHFLVSGERFILHHPLLDSTIIGLTLLTIVLSRTVGTIL